LNYNIKVYPGAQPQISAEVSRKRIKAEMSIA
jgi:hypothetical protein